MADVTPKATVVVTRRYVEDLSGVVSRLEAEGPLSWIDLLEAELREARAFLELFPQIGVEWRKPIRRLSLRKTPFIIWYEYDEGKQRVLFLRLYHSSRKRLSPEE